MTFEYYARSSTTTTTKNKKHLTLETVPRTQRKYLGEPDDPHYIPKSPLIERQSFTEQEEGELKRLCALALADIPHSDGPDPVIPPSAPRAALPTARKASAPVRTEIKPPQPQFADDSRTPSEASRRDTFGTATDYSTPLTSAGITPGEPVKRFSSSKTQNSSNLRYDQWQQGQQQQQRGKSHTHPPPTTTTKQAPPRPESRQHHTAPRPDSRQQRHLESRKSAPVPGERTLRFVKDSPPPRDLSPSVTQSSLSKSPSAQTSLNPPPSSTSSNNNNRFSQAELNKQLPPLPPHDTNNNNDLRSPNKPAHLARMLKTITRKKSSALLQDDDNNRDLAPLSIERPGTSMTFIRSAPASPATADGGKRRFMKLFGRRERAEDVAVS